MAHLSVNEQFNIITKAVQEINRNTTLLLSHRHTGFSTNKQCYETTISDFGKFKNNNEFIVDFGLDIFKDDFIDIDIAADVKLSDSIDKKALKRCVYLIKKAQQKFSNSAHTIDINFLINEVKDAIKLLNKVKNMHLKLVRCEPASGYLNIWITDARIENPVEDDFQYLYVDDGIYLNDECDIDKLMHSGDVKPGAENWKRNGKVRLLFNIFKIINIWYKNKHPELLEK